MTCSPYFPINTQKSGLQNFIGMIVKAGVISSKDDFISLTEISEIEDSAVPNAKGLLTYKVNGHTRKRNVKWTRSPIPAGILFVKTLTAAEIDLAVSKSQIVQTDIDYEVDLINRRIKVFALPDSVVYFGQCDFKVVVSLYGQNTLVLLDTDDALPVEPDPDELAITRSIDELDPHRLYVKLKDHDDSDSKVGKVIDVVNTDTDEFDPLAAYKQEKANTES